MALVTTEESRCGQPGQKVGVRTGIFTSKAAVSCTVLSAASILGDGEWPGTNRLERSGAKYSTMTELFSPRTDGKPGRASGNSFPQTGGSLPSRPSWKDFCKCRTTWVSKKSRFSSTTTI